MSVMDLSILNQAICLYDSQLACEVLQMKLRAQRAVMAFMAKTALCCVQGLYIHPYGRYPYNLKGGVTIFNDCPYRVSTATEN